jgi:hypothetical protein
MEQFLKSRDLSLKLFLKKMFPKHMNTNSLDDCKSKPKCTKYLSKNILETWLYFKS